MLSQTLAGQKANQQRQGAGVDRLVFWRTTIGYRRATPEVLTGKKTSRLTYNRGSRKRGCRS